MALVTRIESLDDARLDVYARLSDHQLRNRLDAERGVVVAESRLVVEVALDSGLEVLSLLVDERDLEASEGLLERVGNDVAAYVLPHEQVKRLVGYQVTRGLLAALRRPRPLTPDEALAHARRVAVLEDLVDVTNVGALFRSAAALGADAVLLSPRCADPLVRRAVRVSMGTVFRVPWARFDARDWPTAALSGLRGRGFDVMAMALVEGAVPLDDASLLSSERRALVFGTEGTGLARRTIEACDRSVVIPMGRGVDSLNVAASSAVAFWQLFR